MKSTREFRYTQCMQFHRTTKSDHEIERDCGAQADKQRLQLTKVAGCDNKSTAHSAVHKRCQQLDDNLATTYQLDAYIPPVASAANRRVQNNMHK